MDDKLPAIEMEAVCEKIGKFTKSEIMELVQSLSKASVENSLTQLMKDGGVDRHGKGKATFYARAFEMTHGIKKLSITQELLYVNHIQSLLQDFRASLENLFFASRCWRTFV